MDWMTPLPVRRVQVDPGAIVGDATAWPYTLPVVQHLQRDGLDLGPITVLVGENGAGKSTLIEAIAMAFGLSGEGGSVSTRHSTRRSESSLAEALVLHRGAGASKWGYFLRAESLHGLYTYLEGIGGPGPRFHELSHGESFLEILQTTRFDGPGLFVMDEPEAGLSFISQLALLGLLQDLGERPGAQVLIATHSPVLAALPGATLLEVGPDGLQESAYDDLEVVDSYRRFLDAPERYLRHLR